MLDVLWFVPKTEQEDKNGRSFMKLGRHMFICFFQEFVTTQIFRLVGRGAAELILRLVGAAGTQQSHARSRKRLAEPPLGTQTRGRIFSDASASLMRPAGAPWHLGSPWDPNKARKKPKHGLNKSLFPQPPCILFAHLGSCLLLFRELRLAVLGPLPEDANKLRGGVAPFVYKKVFLTNK